jgi:hypothetical protein
MLFVVKIFIIHHFWEYSETFSQIIERGLRGKYEISGEPPRSPVRTTLFLQATAHELITIVPFKRLLGCLSVTLAHFLLLWRQAFSAGFDAPFLRQSLI